MLLKSRLASMSSAITFGLLLAQLAGCGVPEAPATGEGTTAETREALVLGRTVSVGDTVVAPTTSKVPPSVTVVAQGGSGAGSTVGSGGGMVVGPETSPPPPSDDSPSLVTLFSGNGWGDALNQQVVPSANSAAEAENTITFDMLENANLVSRVSSVRLVCGGRATQVMLLDFPNTGPLDHWWPSPAVKSFVLECDPFQTVTANLQQAAPELAGRVGSAHILAHARNKKPVVLFSTTAANIWAGTPLPDGASAPTGPLMQMTSSTSFRVTQDLVLTDFWCGDHDARMVLRVLMNQNKTFLVEVLPTETRVSSGTGDTWGCLSGMQDHLDKGADAAAKKLAALLPRSFLLAGDHPRYYFIPSIAMRVFDLGSGG